MDKGTLRGNIKGIDDENPLCSGHQKIHVFSWISLLCHKGKTPHTRRKSLFDIMKSSRCFWSHLFSITSIYLRFATSHESWIQATCSHRMLLTDPSNESFQTKTVTTVWGSTIPKVDLLAKIDSTRTAHLLSLISIPVILLW